MKSRFIVLVLLASALLVPSAAWGRSPESSPTGDPPRADDTVATARSGEPLRAAPSRLSVLVVPLYWTESPTTEPRYQLADMERELTRTQSWFSRVSRGRHTMSYHLLDWKQASENLCPRSRHSKATKIARQRAKAVGVDASRYQRLMVMMPQCHARSWGQMPGNVTWILSIPARSTIVHELGHNLGLHHANSLQCGYGGIAVPVGGWCKREEYGDRWDEMGSSTGQFSVPILKKLGWAGNIVTVTKSGHWDLAAAEDSGDGIQALKIRAGGKDYWVEYRRDSSVTSSGNARPGLIVRRSGGPGGAFDIIDGFPGDPDPWTLGDNADLVNAATHTEVPIKTPEGIEIVLLSAEGDPTASVWVTIPGSPAPSAPVITSIERLNLVTVRVHFQRGPYNRSLRTQGFQFRVGSKVQRVYVGPYDRTFEASVGPGDKQVSVREISLSGASKWSVAKRAPKA